MLCSGSATSNKKLRILFPGGRVKSESFESPEAYWIAMKVENQEFCVGTIEYLIPTINTELRKELSRLMRMLIKKCRSKLHLNRILENLAPWNKIKCCIEIFFH
ncbi:hypothetical protein AVEN_126087-1 [Araneus ventricosus]|uniref:Uncharacterized protein n=1 Tax=Araneus ventricosus TaxID=182803 RepID=A0A4Y2CLY7_ARAVE|nr:hypothetical protein AVEN_126087-1 [Araneus ventricosus]